MNIDKVVEIAKKAGGEIMDVYESDDFDTEIKSDDSPLTKADLASNNIIISSLKALFPEISIMSEETEHASYNERGGWVRFWCVDPLDGTKEFIKKNGEFTVNIALIERGVPVFGVVHAPALSETYWSDGEKSWKEKDGKVSELQVASPENTLVVVGSRSHQTPELLEFIEQKKKEFSQVELVSRGSSLKICMVADGSAHIYYRSGPTMEWDTAAGHAVVRTAGGEIVQMNGSKFSYNKENLKNPGFIVRGNM